MSRLLTLVLALLSFAGMSVPFAGPVTACEAPCGSYFTWFINAHRCNDREGRDRAWCYQVAANGHDNCLVVCYANRVQNFVPTFPSPNPTCGGVVGQLCPEGMGYHYPMGGGSLGICIGKSEERPIEEIEKELGVSLKNECNKDEDCPSRFVCKPGIAKETPGICILGDYQAAWDCEPGKKDACPSGFWCQPSWVSGKGICFARTADR